MIFFRNLPFLKDVQTVVGYTIDRKVCSTNVVTNGDGKSSIIGSNDLNGVVVDARELQIQKLGI